MAYINASKDAGLKKNRITKRETSGYVNASKSKDDEKNRGGLLGGTGYVLGNAALGFSGVMEGVADIGAATGDLLRGDTSMAKYRFLDNNIAEAQQKLTEWYNPNKAMQFAGDVSSGIGNSLVFMIPYAGPYLAAAGYSGMGISGAAEKTGDVGGKEIAYGIASGGLEFALEKLTGGIGRAGKNLSAAVTRKLGRESVEATAKAAGRSAAGLAGKVTGKGLAGTVLKETAKGALGEGVEESLSELIDPGLQRLFNIDENAEVDFKNVLYAGLVGAVSGGLMTAGPAAINYKSAVKTGREIREKGEAEELVRFARDTVLKAAERKQGKYKAAAEAAKVPTDAGALKRFAGAVNPLSEARKQTRAGKRVDGIADTVKKNLDTYERYMQNPNKTAKELEISDAVLGELRGNLFILENATLLEMYEESILELGAEDKQEFVDRINRMAKADGREKFDYTIADLDKNTDDILTTIAGEYMMEDQYGNLLKDLKSNASAKQGTGDAAQTVVQATEGEGAVQAEQQGAIKSEANTEGFEGIGEEEIIRGVAGKVGLSQMETDMMLTAYRSGSSMDAETFAKAFSEGILYGRQGRNPADVVQGSLLASMNPYERQAAIEAGRVSAIAEEDRRDSISKEKKKPAREASKQKKKTYVTLELPDGVRMKDLSPKAYAAYKAAEVLGEALQTDIVVHATLGQKAGRKVNGYLDRTTNQIHVALDAGADGTALFTLAHEVTHYIREWAPREYQKLADFVSNKISGNMEDLVSQKVEFLRNLDEYKNLTVSELNDAAHEEVVADALETILSDGNVLEDLATYDKSLWEKIKIWIADALKKIRAVYEGLKPNSQAAQVLSETMDTLEELERLFAEGVRAAGERTRTAEVETESSTERGKIYDIVILEDGRMYVHASRNVISGSNVNHWKKQITEFFKQLLDKKPSLDIRTQEGDILTLTMRQTEYKARDDYKQVNKNRFRLENNEFLVKLHAEAHIDELTEIGKKNNKGVVEDSKDHDFAKDGFTYRTAFFKDFDGKYYKLDFSIGHNGDTATVYNIGKIKEDVLPSAKIIAVVGSKGPWSTSSDNSISQSERNVNRKFSISDESLIEKYPNSNLSQNISDLDSKIRYSIEESTTEDAFEDAVRRMEESETAKKTSETVEEPTVTSTGKSFREVLAEALEGSIETDAEYRVLREYADSIERLDGLQRQINDLNIMAADLRDKQFHSPDEAVRSAAAKELQELYKERNRIEDEMAKGDGKITKLRQTEPIRNLMKSVERSAKDNFEAKEKTRSQSSEITSRVRTVRRILGTLNTMLYHPNKQKHVPDALRDLTEVALRSQDPKAFSRNRDHIRELAELSEKIERLEKKVARTALEQKRLDKMKSRYEFLEADTISTKRQAEALLTAFEEYQRNTTDDMTFDKALIDNMREHVKKIEEATLSKMTLQSVTAVEDFYRMLKHQVDNANTTFATERALNIDDLGKKSADETRETKDLKFLSPKGNEWVAMDGIRKFFWKNVKPLTVFEAIGSGTFLDLFKRVMDGEEVWALDILEAREKILEAREKHGYKEWELDKREAVKTKSGTVSLSLSERMALYAYSFREQAISHLEGGGFILDNKATVKDKALSTITIEKRLNDSTRYVMDAELMGELADTLTDAQKEYVREMQSYLTKLGEKGNEVSLKLYGLKLFTEKYYFPIKVRSEYIASQTGKSGDPNIKNRGMTKEVVPNAKDPLVLQGFDNIMVDHINSMATYHAFVLPIEDLTRVLNYKPVNYLRDENGNIVLDADGKPKVDADAENDYSTLKAVIQSKYGEAANNYIVQLIRDLNGGARRDAAAGIIDRGITAFKRASTMASLSVLVQQPTSLVRAAAYIEPKYLFGNASIVDFKNHKELWERVKKYAPVAIIKEMGGYDTGVGARTGDYLNAAEYGRGERLKGFATDANYRAEVFGKGAAYADEMAWIQMFEACVSEQADKRGKPRDSEEVLKAAGKRFTEIIRHTQVYDSTLTRSEYMRSKDTGDKMVTAFMAEPSTVVSMVAEALMRFERGDVKFLRSTAGAVIGSVILNALFSSLVYAMRDDDEDKSYEEKYLSTLAMETAEGFNPAEYLPYVRDIMSLVKGYEIERSDMTLIGDLVNSIRRITSSNQSVSQKMMNTGSAVAAFFGLPVTNIRRDVNGAIYTFFKQTDTERFTQKGLSVALKEEFDTMWGLWDDETTNGYQLYQSVLDGDSRHFARVAARFDTDKAVEMALRKALRDYDPRINEAAIARIEGELDVYESIVKQIEAEGHFDRNITIRAINNEINYIKDHMEDDTVPKVDDAEEENESIYESLYNTSDLNAALEREDKGNFADVYASLLTDKIAAGKTEAQAKSSIRSSITAYWKKQYIAAWEANDTAEIKRIQSILLSTGLYGSRNDVAEMGQGWVKAYAASKTKK